MSVGPEKAGSSARGRWRAVVGAGFAVSLVGGAVATAAPASAVLAAPALYVSPAGANGQADTSCATAAYATPQAAVNAAAAGDTIVVCAGTYTGGVTIPSGLDGLTLDGAQQGVDARTRTGASETVITDSGGGASGSSGIGVGSNGVTIDGFTLQDPDDATGAPGYGFGVDVASSVSGTRIVNDIITNNAAGIYLNSNGTTPDLVQHDLITGNNQAGSTSGDGIYGDQGTSNATIDSNGFTGIGVNSGGISFSGSQQSGISITNNSFTGTSTLGGTAVVLFNVANSTVTGNTVSGTGPAPSQNDAFLLGGGDSGITVNSNVLQSSAGWALDVQNYTGTANSSVTAKGNQFDAANALGGVNVGSGAYTSGAQVAASGNWWGDPSGPGPVGPGAGAKVSSAVDYSNWCITSTCPSVPASPTAVTASAPSSSSYTAVVSWTAPATDGGSALTGYQVVPYDQTTELAGRPQGASPGATSAVVGVTPGDSYTFTVTAANAVGSSAPSAASNPVVGLSEPASQTDSGTSSTPNGTASATVGTAGSPGSVSATATGGEGTVTVSTYPSDPGAGFQAGGTYFDVSLSPGSTFSQVVFQVCGVPAGDTIKWYDAVHQAYSPASDQSARSGSGECVTVTVNSTTSPNIDQLNGTVFAIAPAGGYWLAGSDGGVFADGVPFLGSLGATHLNAPIVGVAADPATAGYWLVGKDGGIFGFNAPFFGSLGAVHLNKPIVGIAATPDGGGYWLVASDGGVFPFGDANFFGSLGAVHLNAPIVGIAATRDNGGYLLAASDGGVFPFGDANFYGSMGASHLNAPIVGVAPDPKTGGYWLVARDGGIFDFNAPFLGSLGALKLNAPIVGMAYSNQDGGYRMVASDGGVFVFHSGFFGSQGGTHLNAPVIGITNL